MDHFPASPAWFDEVLSFQELDFDNIWDTANASVQLSDEEKSLFPDSENSNMDAAHNPMLTSALFDEDAEIQPQGISTSMDCLELPVDEDLHDLFREVTGSSVIDLPLHEEENKTVLPSPTKRIVPADIMSIHSYSQQPQSSNQSSEEEEVKPAVEEKPISKPMGKVIPSRKVTKRVRKPVKRFEDSSDEEIEEPVTKRMRNKSSTSKSKSSFSKKVKLYEMEKFDDPEQERCRLNAINAKINRDRKKNEKNAMSTEMSQLRQENKNLKKKNAKYRQRLTSFEARLEMLESIIRSHQLSGELKASGNDDSILKGIESSSSLSSDDDQEVIYYD